MSEQRNVKAYGPAYPQAMGNDVLAPVAPRYLGLILNDTADALAILNESLVELEKRLAALLVPIPQPSPSNVASLSTACTPATELAATNEQRIRQLITRVQDLHERIAL